MMTMCVVFSVQPHRIKALQQSCIDSCHCWIQSQKWYKEKLRQKAVLFSDGPSLPDGEGILHNDEDETVGCAAKA